MEMIEKPKSARPWRERIARIQRRYQSGDAFISVERARYYTESWKDSEGQGIPDPIRISLAMKNVYEKMTHYVDPDDRIAGHWTEVFLGAPIDIERGVFNRVLEGELTKASILLHRGRSAAKGLAYVIKKGTLAEFIRNQKRSRVGGAAPLDMGFKTMSERKINPYRIRPDNRRELLKELLPFWKNKTVVDRLEVELTQSGLYSKDMHEFAVALPGNTSRQVAMLSTCTTISTYQGHVILDYGKVLRTGLAEMQGEVRNRLEDGKETDPDKRAFYKSVDIALEGVRTFARRLADALEAEMNRETEAGRKSDLKRMSAACRTVPELPAGTFREAIQSLWTVKTAVELAHPVNLHCFGRLDQLLFPYYQKDLAEGRIDPEGALELLEELLLKIMSQNIRPESNLLGNFYHRFLGSSPVTVGGVNARGEDATNDLTYLFLHAAHGSKAITNLSVRVAPSTPKAVLDDVARYLAEGTSSYSLFNDPLTVEAMTRRGFALEDARDYAIMGCVEATCPGKTGSMSANALQLARLLDITCRNGDSRILAGVIKAEGLRTGDPDTFQDFDRFLEALYQQGDYFIRKLVEGSNIKDRLFAEHLPAPLISAFMDGCLEKGKDATAGGARYDLAGISMINSIANLVDSLYVIKKLIFEEKAFDFKTLIKALDDNFVGYDDVFQRIKNLTGKWGNGNPEVDELARTVTKTLFEKTFAHRSINGAPFVVYVISMITHTIDGRLSIAGPDGRPASSPYAASCNPYNVEKSGATAALRSVARLPFEDVLGCAVNMKFHPTAIGRDQKTRDKWASLLKVYFKLGGMQLQPTAVSAETLKKARETPSDYGDLIVKVGGYSTYFVDLGREIQEEVIARTEHC